MGKFRPARTDQKASFLTQAAEMAPMMKSTVMTKSALTAALAESCEVKRAVISAALSTLASIAATEAKNNGKIRHSWCCGHQDSPEEGDQGREARDFRQNGHGEGEAGQDHRQGLPREGPQGRVLRASGSVASSARRLRVCFSISSSCSSSIPPSEEYSCHFVQVGRRVRGHAWPFQCQDA